MLLGGTWIALEGRGRAGERLRGHPPNTALSLAVDVERTGIALPRQGIVGVAASSVACGGEHPAHVAARGSRHQVDGDRHQQIGGGLVVLAPVRHARQVERRHHVVGFAGWVRNGRDGATEPLRRFVIAPGALMEQTQPVADVRHRVPVADEILHPRRRGEVADGALDVARLHVHPSGVEERTAEEAFGGVTCQSLHGIVDVGQRLGEVPAVDHVPAEPDLERGDMPPVACGARRLELGEDGCALRCGHGTGIVAQSD